VPLQSTKQMHAQEDYYVDTETEAVDSIRSKTDEGDYAFGQYSSSNQGNHEVGTASDNPIHYRIGHGASECVEEQADASSGSRCG